MESSSTCKGVVKGHGGHGAAVRAPGIGEFGPVGLGDLVAQRHPQAPGVVELLEFGGVVHVLKGLVGKAAAVVRDGQDVGRRPELHGRSRRGGLHGVVHQVVEQGGEHGPIPEDGGPMDFVGHGGVGLLDVVEEVLHVHGAEGCGLLLGVVEGQEPSRDVREPVALVGDVAGRHVPLLLRELRVPQGLGVALHGGEGGPHLVGQSAHGQVDPIEKDVEGRGHEQGHRRAGQGRRQDLMPKQAVRVRRVLQVQKVVARGEPVADKEVQPPPVPKKAHGAGRLLHGAGQGGIDLVLYVGHPEGQARALVIAQEGPEHGELPPLRRLVHGLLQSPGQGPLLPEGGVRGPPDRGGDGRRGHAEHAPVEDQGAEEGG